MKTANDIIDNCIVHYGKKGMRWGKRSRKGSVKVSKKTTTTKPKAKDLSDDDLKKAVNRMQMEKQYTSLVKGESSKKGADFAKGLALNVAKNAATTIATKQVAKVLRKL